MLKYKMKSQNDNIFKFFYYPNGNFDAPGEIEVVGNSKSGRVIEQSPEDYGNYYAFHAIHGIDTSTCRGTVAWY